VVSVQKPYKLASREFQKSNTLITLPAARAGDQPVVIGGPKVVVVAGPCSVETPEIMLEIARYMKAAGATMLRAGAFKPRTSPYAFQGLGVEGLRILSDIRAETGLPFVTEVMDTRDVEMVAEVADMIQIGARNTQNFSLLKAVGRVHKPVLLKRGISGTLEELLMSAEYILSQGNEQVVLCERGIRTYEKATRNTLDLNALPVLHKCRICRWRRIPAMAPAMPTWSPPWRGPRWRRARTPSWWRPIPSRPRPPRMARRPSTRPNLPR
jgi:3-deoxy-7-phosphoheptulonate synthase